MPWYVVYTKPRNEKRVAELLAEKQVKVYCPVTEEVRQWSDRKKKVIQPVFPSYVFVYLEDYGADSAFVLSTAGVVRFLWWLGKPGIVRDEEIEAIRNFLSAYKDVKIAAEVRRGQTAVIKEGILKGKEGRVVQVKKDQAYLHLPSLGINLIAKVQVHMLEVSS